MSAYQVQLEFERDFMGAPHGRVVVRDPLWPEGEVMAISPECVSLQEIRHEVTRLKERLDELLSDAEREFSRKGKQLR